MPYSHQVVLSFKFGRPIILSEGFQVLNASLVFKACVLSKEKTHICSHYTMSLPTDPYLLADLFFSMVQTLELGNTCHRIQVLGNAPVK